MNPELPDGATPELEQRLTALLLGELPEAEAAALRDFALRNPEAGRTLQRLERVMDFLREAQIQPPDAVAAPQPSLRLSDSRRQVLLQHFKTVKPAAFKQPAPRRKANYLVRLAIAALFMILLLPTVLPFLDLAKKRPGFVTQLPMAASAPDTDISENHGLAVYTSGGNPMSPSAGNTDQPPVNGRASGTHGGAPLPAAEQEMFRRRYAVAPPPTPARPASPNAPKVQPPTASTRRLEVVTNSASHSAAPSDSSVKLNFRDHQVALVGTTPSKPFDAPASLAPGQQIPPGNRGGDVKRAVGDTLTVGGVPIEESRGDELARATLKEAKGANLSDLKPQETEGVAAGVAVETSSDHFGAFVPAAPPVVNPPQGDTTIRATLSSDPSAAGKPIESADKDSAKGSLGFPMSSFSAGGLVAANIPQGRGGRGGEVAGATRSGAYSLDGVGYSEGKVPEPATANGAVTLEQLAEVKKRDVENFFKSVTPLGTIDPATGLPALGRALDREVDKLAAAKPAVETPELLAKLEDRVAETLKRSPLPVEPEVVTREQAFSTFSLNVSDVSFRLAGASLESGALPDPASIRSEEFINAFDYHDPEPAPGQPIAFAWERARYPFAQNRDVLRFSVKTAAQGRAPGRPLSLVLLLDNSGSMERADRVRIIRESLRVLAAQLQPQDKLSVVSFARTARLWVDGVPGSHAAAALEKMATLSPEGGTNLEEALRTGYETARRHFQPGGINRVVLLTDGAANLGEVTPATLKTLVEDQRRQGVALDCFGIGWEGYNDDLLETLSRNGDGRYGFINSPEAAAADFAGQLAGALQVAASDVKVQVQFNPARVRIFRQIGYVKHQLTKEQFRDNTVDAAEIGAAESGNALYVIETLPQGSGPVATVRVRYKVPGTSDYKEQEWVVGYQGNAPALEGAPVALRLAGTAAAFSEWLATNPFAAEVSPDRLLQLLQGIPAQYSSDPRPQRLEWMIRQAKSISSK